VRKAIQAPGVLQLLLGRLGRNGLKKKFRGLGIRSLGPGLLDGVEGLVDLTGAPQQDPLAQRISVSSRALSEIPIH
jgi:hypothetical protein